VWWGPASLCGASCSCASNISRDGRSGQRQTAANEWPSTKGHDKALCKLLEYLLHPNSFGHFLEQHKVNLKAVLRCVGTWCEARLANPTRVELAEREGTA
jgi:hypothetical protein